MDPIIISITELLDLFASLQKPKATSSDGLVFSASPIDGYMRHRLAKDSHGAPSILISTIDTAVKLRPSPIALEHVGIQFDVDCRISRSDGQIEEGRYTVVRCTEGDKTLYGYFLRILSTLLASLGDEPTRSEVSAAIEKIVQLFQATTELPRKSVQGLWAELFVIARARHPDVLLSGWHTTAGWFDFSLADQRLEIKSTVYKTRQHYFTLEQLAPLPAATVLIVSLFVERSSMGTSVIELMDKVRSKISDNTKQILHLEKTVAFTLGDNWRSGLEEQFDIKVAEDTLGFFDPSSIPSVNPHLPKGVSEVRFKADLTNVSPIDTARYKEMGGLFSALLKK